MVVKEVFGTNLVASGEQGFVGSRYRFQCNNWEGTLSQVQLCYFY